MKKKDNIFGEFEVYDMVNDPSGLKKIAQQRVSELYDEYKASANLPRKLKKKVRKRIAQPLQLWISVYDQFEKVQ